MGKHTKSELKAFWDAKKMKYDANPDDPTITWDMNNGEMGQGELRFSFVIADKVNFGNRAGKMAASIMKEKQKKAPTEADVNQARARVATGHAGFQGKILYDRGGSAVPKGPLGQGGAFTGKDDAVLPAKRKAQDQDGQAADVAVEVTKVSKPVSAEKCVNMLTTSPNS